MGKRYQVVIVGGGPVGVGLAVDLGVRGISCAVVERRTQLAAVPAGDVRDALSALCDYVVTRTS